MADSEADLLARFLARAALEFTAMRPMLPTYLHLIVSSLFPIYTGAHASLSRPSSAAKPAKKRKTTHKSSSSDDEDEAEEDEARIMEGLSPTDAILMPLMAGAALASLYFLLKWLKDPTLLNKILNAYFAIFGVFSVARLITDALDFGHTIVFPRRYARSGVLYAVDGKKGKAVPVAGAIIGKEAVDTPLPGWLARIPLSDGFKSLLWRDRAMPGRKWTLKLHMHRIIAGKVKIGPHGITGVVIGLAAVAYFNLVDKPWYLTNLLGFGFSYNALQLMSPTTFATGSLILSALFFYDIYFVFYTPMMVTVAKSLDVPIKLVFPRPPPPGSTSTLPSYAMLGLGDIVLPGIMIGLALRFDLYLFYLRRQKQVPSSAEDSPVTTQIPTYYSFTGRWTDYFWSHSFLGRPLWASSSSDKAEAHAPFTFPKVYFTAALVGYTLGLLATLGVMMIFDHAQPALLYLVPGVLGSVWLTALLRGELRLMWAYSEEIDEVDELGKKDDVKKTNESQVDEKEGGKNPPPRHAERDEHGGSDHDTQVNRSSRRQSDREVFSLSIEAPWPLKQLRNLRESKAKSVSNVEFKKDGNGVLESNDGVWTTGSNTSADGERGGKRARLR